MTAPLLECIPNLSEGRDPAALERLWHSLQQISGLQCLHRSADPDHHRSVLTLAGPPAALREAAHAMLAWASRQIDLRQHQGVHPRIGALDVLPLVPLQGISQAEAVAFSHELGAELAARWQLPIYFYEASARQPERQALPNIRRGGFEQLNARIRAGFVPDAGPHQAHTQLGATVLGVRPFLIAWNVFLESQDLALAQDIARRIRARDGGFKAVRALGLYLPGKGQVQVSMNLLDFRQTGLWPVYQQIQALAAAAGVRVGHSELIGLPPREALLEAALQALQTGPDFQLDHVLEARLKQPGLRD